MVCHILYSVYYGLLSILSGSVSLHGGGRVAGAALFASGSGTRGTSQGWGEGEDGCFLYIACATLANVRDVRAVSTAGRMSEDDDPKDSDAPLRDASTHVVGRWSVHDDKC